MNENTKNRNVTASLEFVAAEKLKFDEFLRRQLGVADAKNPKLVVEALRKRYSSEAARLDEESLGASISFTAQPAPVVAAAGTPSESPGAISSQEVRTALDADLKELMEHPASRDYRSALTGWRDAILAELDEGDDATLLAADPVSRDRAFYSMRKLGDYARVARMVSLINPALTPEFRRLASTLDEATMVLRVLSGEALFRAGFGEGGSVFQVALQDLRQRREALIHSLERFTASTSNDDSDNWGDAEASYGALLRKLSALGHHDLRALIRPDVMARLLDVLLDARAQYQSYYLRGIAATVPVELVQLRRLQKVAESLLPPTKKPKQDATTRAASSMDDEEPASSIPEQAASAPLSAFVQALGLFIESFAGPGTGARLLKLALPSPLASLQLARADEGGEIVQSLIRLRAQIAEELDSVYEDPDFDPLQWDIPPKLDRLIYDIDRAIDLYLMGGGNNLDGPEEARARLYGKVIETWLGDADWTEKEVPSSVQQQKIKDKLLKLLTDVKEELLRPEAGPPNEELERQFNRDQRLLELQWKELAVELTQVATGRRDLLDLASELYPPEKDLLALMSPRSQKEQEDAKRAWVEKDTAYLHSLAPVPASTRISSLGLVTEVARVDTTADELRSLHGDLIRNGGREGVLREQITELAAIKERLEKLETLAGTEEGLRKGLVGTDQAPGGAMKDLILVQAKQREQLAGIREQLGKCEAMLSVQERQRDELAGIREQLGKCEAMISVQDKQREQLAGIREQLGAMEGMVPMEEKQRDELAGIKEQLGKLETMATTQDKQREQLAGIREQLRKLEAMATTQDKQRDELAGIKEQLRKLEAMTAAEEGLRKGLVGTDQAPGGVMKDVTTIQDKQREQLAALKDQLGKLDRIVTVQEGQRDQLTALKEQLRVLDATVTTQDQQREQLAGINAQLGKLETVATAQGGQRDELAGIKGQLGSLQPLLQQLIQQIPGLNQKLETFNTSLNKRCDGLQSQLDQLKHDHHGHRPQEPDQEAVTAQTGVAPQGESLERRSGVERRTPRDGKPFTGTERRSGTDRRHGQKH